MDVLKWFKHNLCTYDEYTGETTPEAKIISGDELFHQLNRLALMEAYFYMRSWREYVYDPLVKHVANRIYKAYIRNQVYTNLFYKIRLKDNMSIEEYGLKAIQWKRVYLPKKPKKYRSHRTYGYETICKSYTIDDLYRYLTKKTLNHKEFIDLIKIINSLKDLKWDFNNYYEAREITIPGKFFIRGKEFPEIRLVIPFNYEIKDWKHIKNFKIERGIRYPYAENIYIIRYGLSHGRPFEMGRDKWMLSSENCWA